jgi:hypothetical protein
LIVWLSRNESYLFLHASFTEIDLINASYSRRFLLNWKYSRIVYKNEEYTRMSSAPEPMNPATARQQARLMQSRLEERKMPTVTGTRQLIAAVLSLATQVETGQQALTDAQSQREHLARLVEEWNTLFAALNRVGLSLWDGMKNGIYYQWEGRPAVGGFANWAAALEAALRDRLGE